MEVKNPRRVLAVSSEKDEQHLSRVIKDITGSAPQPVSTTLAGITHDLNLKTSYYSATVPIWLDLISDPSEWAASFLSDEAKEVLNVLGGLLFVFALPSTPTGTLAEEAKELVRSVGAVRKQGLGGWDWDGVGLVVGIGHADDVTEWDEMCAEAGLEFVQVKGGETGRNEFGEKMGIERVKEALESNDWDSLDASSALSDFGEFEEMVDPRQPREGQGHAQVEEEGEGDDDDFTFGYDPADFEGMKNAIWGLSGADVVSDRDHIEDEKEVQAPGEEDQDQDDQVAKMEMMMRKLQAVKEAGEGMGEEQRRRMAAQAVREVMKDL